MAEQHVRLRDALKARHWQGYATFCREYDRAAKRVDHQLIGSWPSRAQFHRWLSGGLKGLPYADHLRVLEEMLPGWTADQLFETCGSGCPLANKPETEESLTGTIARSIEAGLSVGATSAPSSWAEPSTSMPAPGHAPAAARHAVDTEPSLPEAIARRVLAVAQTERMSSADAVELAGLAGNIVDLDLTIDLHIAADGLVSVTYRYYTLNLTDTPIHRAPRDLWFQHSKGKLNLSSLRDGDRNVTIQRLHTADNIAKFACQFSPAVTPGESVRFGYVCSGGDFRNDFYWRQAFARHTRRFTLNVRHCNIRDLGGFTAIEELPDGTEKVMQETVSWQYEGDDVVMSFTLDRLQPSQYATLRWETG